MKSNKIKCWKKISRERLIWSPIFDDDTKHPFVLCEFEMVAFYEINQKFLFEKITILAERGKELLAIIYAIRNLASE